MLETDNKETYAPSRAIVATHKDNPGDKLFNKFSFSATTQVLFNEMKFRIENLNSDIDFGYMTRVTEEDFDDNTNYDDDCPCYASGNEWYYGLDYSKFTPYIIKAFQEYKTQTDDIISNLTSRIAVLEANN